LAKDGVEEFGWCTIRIVRVCVRARVCVYIYVGWKAGKFGGGGHMGWCVKKEGYIGGGCVLECRTVTSRGGRDARSGGVHARRACASQKGRRAIRPPQRTIVVVV